MRARRVPLYSDAELLGLREPAGAHPELEFRGALPGGDVFRHREHVAPLAQHPVRLHRGQESNCQMGGTATGSSAARAWSYYFEVTCTYCRSSPVFGGDCRSRGWNTLFGMSATTSLSMSAAARDEARQGPYSVRSGCTQNKGGRSGARLGRFKPPRLRRAVTWAADCRRPNPRPWLPGAHSSQRKTQQWSRSVEWARRARLARGRRP